MNGYSRTLLLHRPSRSWREYIYQLLRKVAYISRLRMGDALVLTVVNDSFTQNDTLTWWSTKIITSIAGKMVFLPILVIPFHLCHILLVLLKSNLRHTAYYLFVNLSISDSLTSISPIIMTNFKLPKAYILAFPFVFFKRLFCIRWQ